MLTGANSDGAEGAVVIKQNGGMVLVQDPTQASVDTMPLAAIKAAQVDAVMSIRDIAGRLAEMNERSTVS